MELLNPEARLETLIFRYSAAVAACIWTSLALLAAAIGFRRRRFLGSLSPPAATHSSDPIPSIPPPASSSVVSVIPDFRDSEERESPPPKGKFTAYFNAEEGIEGGDEGGWGRDGGEWMDLLDRGWRGDLGWYCYQDRAAIDGSVVRLWDGYRRGLTAFQGPRIWG